MAQTDVFAFQRSALSAFLYAEVGIEMSGSTLTVLSVLARLGKDPWEEAGQWVQLPRATIVDRLTKGIAQMPLPEQALLDARDTATRLIQLLPTRTAAGARTEMTASPRRRFSGWRPVYVAAAILAVTVVVSHFVARGPDVTTVVPAKPAD